MKRVHSNLLKITSIATFMGFGVSQSALSEIKISSDLEIDSDYEVVTTNSGEDGAKDVKNKSLTQSGRASLSIESTKRSGKYFLKGVGAIELSVDDEEEIQDVYLQIGTSIWDFQIGRFEAIEAYSFGEDLDFERGSYTDSYYQADKARGYEQGVAFHYKPIDGLTLELNTLFYKEESDKTKDANGNSLEHNFTGIRPAISFEKESFSIAIAYDSLTSKPTNSDYKGKTEASGFGLTAKYLLGSIEAGISYASGKEGGSTYDDATGVKTNEKDQETTTMGAFINIENAGPGKLGLGYHLMNLDNGESGANEETVDSNTAFLSYSLPVVDNNGSITFGLAMTNSELGGKANKGKEATEEVQNIRIRFNYDL